MYGFKEKTKYFNELRNPAAAEVDLRLLRASAPAHPKLKMFARNPQRYADDILYTLLDLKSKDAIRLNRRESEKAKEENGAKNILNTSGACTGGEIQSGGNAPGNCDKAGNTLAVSQQLLSDNSEGSGGTPVRSSKTEDSHDGNTTTDLEAQEGTGGASVQEEKNPFEIDAEIYEKQAETELRKREKQEEEKRAEQAEDQAEVLEQENQELKEELETEQDARAEAEERAEQAEQALEEEKKKEPTKVVPKSKSTKSTRKSTGKTSKTKTSK
jgi:hypothetical protein